MQILLFHGHSGPAQCLAHRSFGSARKPCYVGHRHAVDMAQAQYNLLRRRQRAHYGHHALYPLDVGRGITEVGHVGSVYAQRVMMTSQIVDAEVMHQHTGQRSHGAAQLGTHSPKLQHGVLHEVLGTVGATEPSRGHCRKCWSEA